MSPPVAMNLACDRCNDIAYSASPQLYAGTVCPRCGEGTLRRLGYAGFRSGRRLAPGVYDHDGELHVDADELADAAGIPKAHPRRQELVEKVVHAIARKHGIPVQTVEDQA